MSFAGVLFAVAALLTAGGAVGVALAKSLVRSALALMVSLIGVSLIYFLLGAEFLAAAQLMVYVGGTLVLMVFGVMLTTAGPFAGSVPPAREWYLGGSIAVILFVILASLSLKFATPAAPDVAELPGIQPLGGSLLGVSASNQGNQSAFALPFELVSIHLLVVLVAAAYLARAKRRVNSAPLGEDS